MKIERYENLGKEAKDKITGFRGIITGYCQHVTGCDTIGIVAQELKDGKTIDAHWFDINRVEILGHGILPASVGDDQDPGACESPGRRG